MERTEAKDKIVKHITEHGGCKASCVSVVLSLIQDDDDEFHRVSQEIPELIEELIEEGRLVSVYYCIPTMMSEQKKFLLPVGTVIIVEKNLINPLPKKDEE